MTDLKTAGEVLEETEAASPKKQLRLPNFEGFAVELARIGFTGALELALSNEDDIKLAKALKLGQKCVITLKVGDREIDLSAAVTARSHRKSKREHSDLTVSSHVITVNAVADAEDDDPDPDA